jgi:hypothetical protein
LRARTSGFQCPVFGEGNGGGRSRPRSPRSRRKVTRSWVARLNRAAVVRAPLARPCAHEFLCVPRPTRAHADLAPPHTSPSPTSGPSSLARTSPLAASSGARSACRNGLAATASSTRPCRSRWVCLACVFLRFSPSQAGPVFATNLQKALTPSPPSTQTHHSRASSALASAPPPRAPPRSPKSSSPTTSSRPLTRSSTKRPSCGTGPAGPGVRAA